MKKTLVSAAVAAAMTAPLAAIADNTLYGNFRGSVLNEDLGGSGSDTTEFVNNASRVGLKGSAGNDMLTGFWHLQVGANNDGGGSGFTDRFYFAGLKGGFGTIGIGKHSTGYKMEMVKMDPFYDTSAGSGDGGSNYGFGSLANGFTENSIFYKSPKFGGFEVYGGIYLDDADDQDFNIGAAYSGWGGFRGGVSYIGTHDEPTSGIAGAPRDADAYLVHASYKADNFSAGVAWQNVDADGDPNGEDEFLNVSGTYNFTPTISVLASYGYVDDALETGNSSFNESGDGYAVGVKWQALKQTSLLLSWSALDFDTTDPGDGSDQREVLSLGLVQKF